MTSNIWGTKFKIVGLASFLPANLGAGEFHGSRAHMATKTLAVTCFSPFSHLQDEFAPSAAEADDHLSSRGAKDFSRLYEPPCVQPQRLQRGRGRSTR